MKLQDILKIKETSECIVHHELTEDWKNCYYQYKGDVSNSNGEVVSKFEEKYNESGWGALDYDHESVFDPTQEVFEDSSLSTVFKRDYTSAVFIKLLKVKIKEYLSLDASNGSDDFDEFINWIDVSGHYAIQDLFEKIGCKKYEITLEQPDDEYLWFSHYEKSGEYDYIWIEEIKTDNKSVKDSKEKKTLKRNEDLNSDEFIENMSKSFFENLKSENDSTNAHDGEFLSYYENGEIKEKGYYKNGEKNGVFFSYTKTGKILNEILYVDGLIEGESKEYYESGQLKEKISYEKGRKNSKTTYYENGNMKTLHVGHSIHSFSEDGKESSRAHGEDLNAMEDSHKNIKKVLEEYRKNPKMFDSEDIVNKALEKNERERNSGNQGGCLVVILFLLSLTLSLII
ncbi:hypothetical protein N9L60_06095 [Flavobacteriales bacterium]|nr:hypothetical protein [Flavobacteriales bacterium]